MMHVFQKIPHNECILHMCSILEDVIHSGPSRGHMAKFSYLILHFRLFSSYTQIDIIIFQYSNKSIQYY